MINVIHIDFGFTFKIKVRAILSFDISYGGNMNFKKVF